LNAILLLVLTYDNNEEEDAAILDHAGGVNAATSTHKPTKSVRINDNVHTNVVPNGVGAGTKMNEDGDGIDDLGNEIKLHINKVDCYIYISNLFSFS
jgi:hypothetical protein